MAQSITATDLNSSFILSYAGPVGPIIVKGSGSYIEHLHLLSSEQEIPRSNNNGQEKIQLQLDQYFQGKRKHFDLQLKFEGTSFQKEVWQALLEIPYGTVITYGELAQKIGRPRAQQAVGSAVGANPLPLLIPCHRVVAKSHLGGFSAPIEWKKWLLSHEFSRFQ
ncbi:MAG: cysteine methyltransferase [Bdellovibrio sp. CG_4_9_14_3_um_filter_39_7]|nr:MAG: cysteine methyltransferase [Bdellovibrio sp. CG_4_9_14_3_um_filter_39_7]